LGTIGAIDAITGVQARELGSREIRANALNPGEVLTEGTQDLIDSDVETAIVSQTPLGLLGQP
jgi:3-oxoacyl-[acyl-carrier protein] reductase